MKLKINKANVSNLLLWHYPHLQNSHPLQVLHNYEAHVSIYCSGWLTKYPILLTDTSYYFDYILYIGSESVEKPLPVSSVTELLE